MKQRTLQRINKKAAIPRITNVTNANVSMLGDLPLDVAVLPSPVKRSIRLISEEHEGKSIPEHESFLLSGLISSEVPKGTTAFHNNFLSRVQISVSYTHLTLPTIYSV